MKTTSRLKKIIHGCEEVNLKGNEIGCLLIHGFRSCPFEMKEYAEYLNKFGYTVQTCLLPGHGTIPDDLLNIKWQDWVIYVENSLEEMKKECEKVILSGLSTGGSIALYLASKRNIDGVIALAPGLYLRQRKSILSHALKYFWKFKNIKSGPDVSIKVESKVYAKVPVRSVSELLLLFNSLEKNLKFIKSPTLIIYSPLDHVVKPDSSLTIYNKISSSNKHIVELEKSYHILTMDTEKNKVFKESAKFINEIIAL